MAATRVSYERPCSHFSTDQLCCSSIHEMPKGSRLSLTPVQRRSSYKSADPILTQVVCFSLHNTAEDNTNLVSYRLAPALSVSTDYPRVTRANVLRCYKCGGSGTMRPATPHKGSRCIMTRVTMIVARTASVRSDQVQQHMRGDDRPSSSCQL